MEKDEDIANQKGSANANGVDWQIYSFEKTNNDGYKYSITMKFSPFALSSKNSDYLEAAWKEILSNYSSEFAAKCGALPTTKEFWYGNMSNYYTLQDMYYSVGEVVIKNVTPGWDLSEASPGGIDLSLRSNLRFAVYYGNGPRIEGGLTISSFSNKLTSNNTGYPLIIFQPEKFTPQNPNGVERNRLESQIFEVLFDY